MITNTPNLIKIEPEMFNILKKLNDKGCQCLLIGGSVRDAILGIEPKDIDMEVYKISYEELQLFLSPYGRVDLVGKKFGVIVFTPFMFEGMKWNGIKYDFSIPRKENKVGVGHTGFEITFDLDMTIQEAAERRDFTFNALAYDPISEQLYDYFGGVEDLNNGIIRHTSDKFKEDYLRVLRGMQFQARFGFVVHPDTIAIMKEMLKRPEPWSNDFAFGLKYEFEHLAKERVYEEWLKWAEKGKHHHLIFKFMRDTGLIEYYPILNELKYTPQDKIYHPEGDVEIHTELCLAHMDKIINTENITGKEKVISIMSILLHDIAKPATTEEQMKNGRMTITSNGHEEMGGVMAKEFLSSIGFNDDLILPISNIIANHLAGVNISAISAPSGQIKAVKKLSRRLFPANITQLLRVMDATGSQQIFEISMNLDVTDKQYEYLLMGRHLIEFGLKPSKGFGDILKASQEAQENGEFSDIDGAKEWLKTYLQNN